VINTHGHADHIAANRAVLEATGARLVAHKLEAPLLGDPKGNLSFLVGLQITSPSPDLLVQQGDTLDIGVLHWQVLHTPGHTPGGISLYCASERVLFTGDALFREGIGRTDSPGGDYDLLRKSIADRLFTLPDETVVYPATARRPALATKSSTTPGFADARDSR